MEKLRILLASVMLENFRYNFNGMYDYNILPVNLIMEQPIVQTIIILENLGRNTKQESINEMCI